MRHVPDYASPDRRRTGNGRQRRPQAAVGVVPENVSRLLRTWLMAVPDNAPPVPQDNRVRSAEAASACAPVPSRRTGCRVLRHVRDGIRRSQPDVQIWAPVPSTGDGSMPVCLYLRGRTSWGNWPEKFCFRIGSGFSKQARKVPMRNWPAHARELHRSDVEGSEATRHVGPPRVGVTGACRSGRGPSVGTCCWHDALAARQGRFYRRFAQRTRIGTIRPKHAIVLF